MKKKISALVALFVGLMVGNVFAMEQWNNEDCGCQLTSNSQDPMEENEFDYMDSSVDGDIEEGIKPIDDALNYPAVMEMKNQKGWHIDDHWQK